MKVFGFTVLLFSTTISLLSAQGTSKYITAYNYLKDGDYLKAKEYIDQAMEYDDARERAKTWVIKGDIYSKLVHPLDGVDYGISPAEAAIVAVEAYTKALGMDTRRTDENQLRKNLEYACNVAFQMGVTAYNEKNYKQALECFRATVNGKSALGETDSLAVYNMGLCNEYLNHYSEAIDNYKQCISINYSRELSYQNIVWLYRTMGDDASALAIVNEALDAYPTNSELLTSKVNLLLAEKKYAEAKQYLDRLLQTDPSNAVLLYSRGTCHTSLGNGDAATNDFKKALEIDPDYFDAAYNLGAAYFNLGVDVNNEALEITDPEAFEVKKIEADGYFQQAQTYLEQAHELSPTNGIVMQSLLQIYVRTGETEKYEAMKTRLQN